MQKTHICSTNQNDFISKNNKGFNQINKKINEWDEKTVKNKRNNTEMLLLTNTPIQNKPHPILSYIEII